MFLRLNVTEQMHKTSFLMNKRRLSQLLLVLIDFAINYESVQFSVNDSLTNQNAEQLLRQEEIFLLPIDSLTMAESS